MGMTAAVIAGTLVGALTSGLNAYEQKRAGDRQTSAAKEQHRQPEKQSVLKHLREIQERNKQQPPQRQRKKSIDRDGR